MAKNFHLKNLFFQFTSSGFHFRGFKLYLNDVNPKFTLDMHLDIVCGGKFTKKILNFLIFLTFFNIFNFCQNLACGLKNSQEELDLKIYTIPS